MLYPKFVNQIHRMKQKTHCLFALIAFTGLLFCQHLAHSQQYVIVDSENGDRLTGIWHGGTDTHFEIEYQGQVLRLPLTGHTLSFTSDIANVQDRTAAKYYRNGLALLELGLPELAQRRFESAIEEFPRYPAAHYQLGLLHETSGNNAKALERFRSVAILDAANFDLVPHLQKLGNAALANEAYAEAVDSYQLILRYYPEHTSTPELRYITGFLLVEELADYDTGLPLLESAIQQNSDTSFHEKAFFLIGKLRAKTDRLEDALYALQGFVMRYPVSERVYEARLIRAEVNLKLGRTTEAGNEASQVHSMSADEAIKERAKQILDQTRWKVYTVADGLPDNRVQAIASDDTRLWVGTPKGVMLFETAFNNWIPIEEGVPQLINNAMAEVPDVQAIAVNSEEVWVGTRSQGAIHYNQLTREIQIYSPTDGFPAWIKDIKMDDAEIWFATDAGVVRKSGEQWSVYNRQQSFIPADDIETLLLMPTTVWGASAKGDIVTFNREIDEWDLQLHRFTEIPEGTAIVGFDTAEDQLLFTWYNAVEKTNGYFRAGLDGLNGKSTTLHTGIEDENDLRNIYIRGILDNTPIVSEENETPPVETPDPPTSEVSPETEALELEEEAPPPPSPTPLVLWIATNDAFYTHHTRLNEWEDTTTPQIVSGELIIHALIVVDNRAWIATNNGLATVSVQ